MKYVENFEEKLDKFAEVIIKIGANVRPYVVLHQR